VQLPKSGETCADYLWNSLVTWIGDDFEKLLDTIASDRRNNPELAKIADRDDYLASGISSVNLED
jgi:hypothetical protein